MMNSKIETIDIGVPLFVSTVENHEALKPSILEAIRLMGTHSAIDSTQSISNTDWFLPNNKPRPYFDIVLPLFEQHMGQILKHDLYDDEIAKHGIWWDTYWFQQYARGDYHSWHYHPRTMFSNVYYVELPEGSAKTSFRLGKKEINVEVHEGQILSFPNSLLHCSKPNEVDGIKTVVVINANLAQCIN